jgi:hypothetical protein
MYRKVTIRWSFKCLVGPHRSSSLKFLIKTTFHLVFAATTICYKDRYVRLFPLRLSLTLLICNNHAAESNYCIAEGSKEFDEFLAGSLADFLSGLCVPQIYKHICKHIVFWKGFFSPIIAANTTGSISGPSRLFCTCF